MPDLPPLAALRAFCAAARHGQFNRAAEELRLSESAVSHQIRRLENLLSTRLFERHGPKVELTIAGARYYTEVEPLLGRLAEVTAAASGRPDRARVTLTLPPTVASMWLIPNLSSFEPACPNIDLQVMATTRLVDLRREQIDLALRYGRNDWPRVEVEHLFSELALPVCRPGYLASPFATDPAAAVREHRLIVNDDSPDEWLEWAEAHEITPPSLDGALVLSHSDQVLSAAERGLGIAIGRRPMVDTMLQNGALIAPFGDAIPTRASFYLCRPVGVQPTAPVRRVIAWLREIAATIPTL